MNTLNIGTRGSQLALIQTRWVEQQISAHFPELHLVTRIIKTSADLDTLTSIRSGSATGVFVREIEEALLSSEIDLAVHSMKDLPTTVSGKLAIGAIPVREDARDALVAARAVRCLEDLPHGAVVGTGSVRRQAQILARRPDLVVNDIRGNVGTRLEKLDRGEYDAVILACAGLTRLGLQDRISRRFEFVEMLPAPGQGALAIEMRKDDHRVGELLARLNDPDTAAAVLAERAFLRRLGGGCNSPIAVYARPVQGTCRIDGLVAAPDGMTILRESVDSPLSDASDAATQLAVRLLSMGGAAILRSLH